jgi:phage baseplate assembly protein W
MAQGNTIGINFPFKDSEKGFYLDMTTTDAEDVRASLMHLLLTNKGERFMLPEFGSDLLKYVFEPNDSRTISDLKLDINTTVSKFIPNIQINDILIENSDLSNELVTIKILYTASDGIYTQSDTLTINV